MDSAYLIGIFRFSKFELSKSLGLIISTLLIVIVIISFYKALNQQTETDLYSPPKESIQRQSTSGTMTTPMKEPMTTPTKGLMHETLYLSIF